MTPKQRAAIASADRDLHAQLGRLRMVVTSLSALQHLIDAYDVDITLQEVAHPLLQLLKANEGEIEGVANAIDEQLLALHKAGVR